MSEFTARVMLVSDNQKFWIKRIVLLRNKKGYIAFTTGETLEDIVNCESTSAWRYAKELEHQPVNV